MKKFFVSYLACLIFFSAFISISGYIKEPHSTETWGPIWLSIIFFIIYGSIPALIGCVVGEFFYRIIKRSYELIVGIPLFTLLGVFYYSFFRIGISMGYIISDFLLIGIPIALSSLVFYFIRRI
ncbi:hypothetical protein [Bacillus cereus group sp. BfR-BA-01383]|uniref:hypothetical protein n=1 Tax=Bacillus cereus group sp. BfR-BA-01383 TaxID=2920327 RepID=UPI001F56B9AC|nr:hypothetical protein [Bacillus cereus group sp. BfR-BA-01383]